MKRFSGTPIRRLEDITYWVIEDPDDIYDFINTEIRKEWEADAEFERRDPRRDQWLNTLSRRRWSLKILETSRIQLNPAIINYSDMKRNYIFSKELAKRNAELRQGIEAYAMVIWPLIVRMEDWVLVDGYCRYATLKGMNIKRTYAYAGSL